MPSALAQGTLRTGTNRKKPVPANRKAKALPPIPAVSTIDSRSLQKPCAAQAQNFSRRAPLDLEELTTANFSGASPPHQPAHPPLPRAFSPRQSLVEDALPAHPILPPPAAFNSSNQPREQPVLRAVAARKLVNVHHAPSTKSQRPAQASAAAAAGRAAAANLANYVVPQKPDPKAQQAARLPPDGAALKQQHATRTLRGPTLDTMPVALAPLRPAVDPREARSSYRKRSDTKLQQSKRVVAIPVLEPINPNGNNFTRSQQGVPPVSAPKISTQPKPAATKQPSKPAGPSKKPGFWKSLFSFATKPEELRSEGQSHKQPAKTKILGVWKRQETAKKYAEIAISRPRDEGHVFTVDSFSAGAEPPRPMPMPSPYIAVTTADEQGRHDSTCTTWGGIIQQALGHVQRPPPKRPAPPAVEAKKAPEKKHARDKSGSKGSKGRFIFERRDSDGSDLSFKCKGLDSDGNNNIKPVAAASKKREKPIRCLNCGQPRLEETGLCQFCAGNDQFFPTPIELPHDYTPKPRANVVTKRRSTFSVGDDNKYVPRPASSVYSFRPSSQYTDPGNPFADEHVHPSRAPAHATTRVSRKPRPTPLAQTTTTTTPTTAYDAKEAVSPLSPTTTRGVERDSPLPSPASTRDSFSSFAFLKDAEGNWRGPPAAPWDERDCFPRQSFWRQSRSLHEHMGAAEERERRDTDFYRFYDEVLPATPQFPAPRMKALTGKRK